MIGIVRSTQHAARSMRGGVSASPIHVVDFSRASALLHVVRYAITCRSQQAGSYGFGFFKRRRLEPPGCWTPVRGPPGPLGRHPAAMWLGRRNSWVGGLSRYEPGLLNAHIFHCEPGLLNARFRRWSRTYRMHVFAVGAGPTECTFSLLEPDLQNAHVFTVGAGLLANASGQTLQKLNPA